MKFRITLKTKTGTVLQQETVDGIENAKGWFRLLWRDGQKDFKSNKWGGSWQGEGFVTTESCDSAGENHWLIAEHKLTERKPHYSKFFQPAQPPKKQGYGF